MSFQKFEICMQNQSYFICRYKLLIISLNLVKALLL